MVHRLHRDWALADAQYAVDWCEVVVRGCKSSRAAGDGGGAHAGGGSCSGAARGRAADDGAGFAVDIARYGFRQARVGCAVQAALPIGSHREVRLGDADRAAGRTQGVVVGREAAVAAGAQSQIGDVGQKLVGLHVFDSQIGCTSAAHGEGLTVHTGCSQIAARHRRAAVIGLRARECQVGLGDADRAAGRTQGVVVGREAAVAAGAKA